MRKLFICTKQAWLASHHACHFHPVGGSAYIDLELPRISDNEREPCAHCDLVLVSAVFNGEYGEEMFTNHPEVASLPDPVFEGTVTMGMHRDNPKTRYSTEHHAALASIGVTDSDTVLDVSRKSAARCKAVRIAHIM